MTVSHPHANDTAAALRLALGPGFGFGGATDRLTEIAVRNTTINSTSRAQRS